MPLAVPQVCALVVPPARTSPSPAIVPVGMSVSWKADPGARALFDSAGHGLDIVRYGRVMLLATVCWRCPGGRVDPLGRVDLQFWGVAIFTLGRPNLHFWGRDNPHFETRNLHSGARRSSARARGGEVVVAYSPSGFIEHGHGMHCTSKLGACILFREKPGRELVVGGCKCILFLVPCRVYQARGAGI
jgi:hypothetical protein